MSQRITVIDSHTGGEPTRIITAGGPPLQGLTPLEARARMKAEFDNIRRATMNEPRGSDILVGALLLPPTKPEAACGVVFFNNAGYLGMCGHGTIGLVKTLQHLGQLKPGKSVLETPVGDVEFELRADGRAALRNVPCRRLKADVQVNVPGEGVFTGDIAYGGNWFYCVKGHSETISFGNIPRLSLITDRIQDALNDQEIGGDDGPIDHIELYGPPSGPHADSRNYVRCPGGAYDRSPCGTGTSAKLACLYADGLLQPGQVWRQESITGSVFEGWVEVVDGVVYPHIAGRAYISAEAVLIVEEDDPFAWGIDAP